MPKISDSLREVLLRVTALSVRHYHPKRQAKLTQHPWAGRLLCGTERTVIISLELGNDHLNRTIKEATVKRFHYERHDQLRKHLTDFIAAYNFARRLKTLNGLTPCE